MIYDDQELTSALRGIYRDCKHRIIVYEANILILSGLGGVYTLWELNPLKIVN